MSERENLYLFDLDLIYIKDFKDKESAFSNIANTLLERGLVNDEYLNALKEREKEFPTGIDLSVLGADLPNVAIPHTESNYCKDTKVILVKLKNEIDFRNMMDPSKELKVGYLFMILNESGGEQANILANLMEFVTNKENMDKLQKASTVEELFKVVNQIKLK